MKAAPTADATGIGAGAARLPLRRIASWLGALGELSLPAKIGAIVLLVVVLSAVFGASLWPLNPLEMSQAALKAPSLAHPMGTDDLGRDVLARVIEGARVSLTVGVLSALGAALIGTFVGAWAGYAGGGIDDVLMRITELFQVIPRFLLAIVVVAIYGGGELMVILVIGALSWISTARIVRARFQVLRREEFVSAATMSGASTLRVIVRHILPNVASYLIVSVFLQMGSAILVESFLSFIGLGNPMRPSWGLLLQQSQLYLQSAWWMTVFPGLALAATILGLNLLGDNLSGVRGAARIRH
jgi:peptide/nickel transport system permease protein